MINEYIPQEEIKNLIQEDLPFIKADKLKENEKIKFKLPDLDLLKTPTKKERERSNKDENNDPEFSKNTAGKIKAGKTADGT